MKATLGTARAAGSPDSASSASSARGTRRSTITSCASRAAVGERLRIARALDREAEVLGRLAHLRGEQHVLDEVDDVRQGQLARAEGK